MSRDFRDRLARLNLSDYADRFVDEGFDTWEVLVDITERDLNELSVKLGHRRKLQRAIAEYKCQHKDISSSNNSDALPPSDASTYQQQIDVSSRSSVAVNAPPQPSGNRVKRKYRRHPKPDHNAPERPSSAYVIFSNHMRDRLKGNELSFTDMAKLVGERWKLLPVDSREQYETQANAAKDRYTIEMTEYKKTDDYTTYQGYLAEFKARAAPSVRQTDGKRQRFYRDGSDERPSDSGEAMSGLGSVNRRESEVSMAAQSSRATPTESLEDAYSYNSHAPAEPSGILPSPRSGSDLHAVKSNSSSAITSSSPKHDGGRDSPASYDQRTSVRPSLDGSRITPSSRMLQAPPLYGRYTGLSQQLAPITSSNGYPPPPPPPTSTSLGMPLRAILRADASPTSRTLPAPIPSGPTVDRHPALPLVPARAPGPSQSPDFSRQSSALSALLQASELARKEDQPNR